MRGWRGRRQGKPTGNNSHLKLKDGQAASVRKNRRSIGRGFSWFSTCGASFLPR
nr:MAG TPA: hypothetical protein [Caudoviricetes sp.]